MAEAIFYSAMMYLAYIIAPNFMRHAIVLLLILILNLLHAKMQPMIDEGCKVIADKFGYAIECPNAKRTCTIVEGKRQCTIEILK